MSESNVAAIVPAQPLDQSLVRPAASIAEIEEVFKEYRALCDRLLNDSDYQQIGSKKFRKKSGWRTLSTAMGVTLKHVERDIVYDDHGRVLRAEFVAQAIAPNGRSMDGWASCDLFEKCCPFGCSRNHTHCKAATGDKCTGAIHWSHPNHDIPATAETRAKNRASADLFGMGEVSAEEIVGSGEEVTDERQGPKCPACGSELWDNRPRIAAGTMNTRAPKWKCKNKECTANNGEPWVSWNDDPAGSGDRPKWLADLCAKANIKQIVAWGAEIADPMGVDVIKIEHLYKAPPDVQKALTEKVESAAKTAAQHPAVTGEGQQSLAGEGDRSAAGSSPDEADQKDFWLDLIHRGLDNTFVTWGQVGQAASFELGKHPGDTIPDGPAALKNCTVAYLEAIARRLKLDERVGV